MFSDAVILGAASIEHLEENLKSAKNGPLHEGESYKDILKKSCCISVTCFLAWLYPVAVYSLDQATMMST